MATAWTHLDDQQRGRLVRLAEQITGTAYKPHRSTLPPVDEDQERLIPQAEAAILLGITLPTLRNWEANGWLLGREKLSNAIYYSRHSLEAAALRVGDAKSPGMIRKLPRQAQAFIYSCKQRRASIENQQQKENDQ